MPLAADPKLTPRWYGLRSHAVQLAYYRSPHRFNIVPAGRRSGKTENAKRKLVRKALAGTEFERARFFAAAPTRDQAKRIYWQDLKDLVPARFKRGAPSESELVIRLINGSELHVAGLDKPERIEGSPWDGGILDEYGNMKGHAWDAHVRPALADRRGWCDLIGCPEGRNHYWDRWQKALAELRELGAGSEWGAFTWMSADILPPEEIAAARRDMDELTFSQEYEASFLNFQGRAYYPFLETTHCAPLKYDPDRELIIAYDFNVDPGVAVVVQEQRLPNGLDGTGVIGEVWIPRNSNTPAVCRRLIADWGQHRGTVSLFGDATGGNRGTAKVAGSDWDLIRAEFRPVFGQRMALQVPAANGPERSRVNAVNTRLKAASGEVRLMVDPAKAPKTVRDLEGVCLLEGGSGEIDKKANPELSHLSDALGYYVVRRFPVGGGMAATKLLGT